MMNSKEQVLYDRLVKQLFLTVVPTRDQADSVINDINKSEETEGRNTRAHLVETDTQGEYVIGLAIPDGEESEVGPYTRFHEGMMVHVKEKFVDDPETYAVKWQPRDVIEEKESPRIAQLNLNARMDELDDTITTLTLIFGTTPDDLAIEMSREGYSQEQISEMIATATHPDLDKDTWEDRISAADVRINRSPEPIGLTRGSSFYGTQESGTLQSGVYDIRPVIDLSKPEYRVRENFIVPIQAHIHYDDLLVIRDFALARGARLGDGDVSNAVSKSTKKQNITISFASETSPRQQALELLARSTIVGTTEDNVQVDISIKKTSSESDEAQQIFDKIANILKDQPPGPALSPTNRSKIENGQFKLLFAGLDPEQAKALTGKISQPYFPIQILFEPTGSNYDNAKTYAQLQMSNVVISDISQNSEKLVQSLEEAGFQRDNIVDEDFAMMALVTGNRQDNSVIIAAGNDWLDLRQPGQETPIIFLAANQEEASKAKDKGMTTLIKEEYTDQDLINTLRKKIREGFEATRDHDTHAMC